MNRFAVLFLLTACGSGSAPHAGRVENRAHPLAAPLARTGRHASNIDLVAASEDGTAAVSQDIRGGTRLWPTLDGVREPVVVPMNRARELHLARTESGFVIAGSDDAGGIEIVAVAGSGRVQARTHLAPEPRYEAVRTRGGELLALKADQVIEIIEPSGHVRARLTAPAGERVGGIVTRGDRALALFEDAGSIRGAWIADATWGPSITAVTLPIGEDGRRRTPLHAGAALSPSGSRLAVPLDRGAAVIDLQAATAETFDVFAERVDLSDDVTLVALQQGAFQVQDLRAPAGASSTSVGVSPVSIGRRILSGAGDQLELCTPEYTRVTPHGVGPRVDVERVPAAKQYLGYRIGSLVGARIAASGLTVSAGTQDLVELASDLHTNRRTALPTDSRTLMDTIRLDARYVLASHAYNATSFAASVLDTATGVTLEIVSTPMLTPMLRYEPSTELLAVGDASSAYLVRRELATSKFETWFRVGSEGADLRVLDPAKTDGVIAVVLHEDAEPKRTRVERIRENQLVVGVPIIGLETSYAGTPLGIDARGRTYVADGDALVAWDGDRELARIPGVVAGEPPSKPHVVAAGDYIALVQGDRLSLFEDDGTPRWDIDAPGLHDVGWMHGELVANFESGLAKLALDDGNITDATCGWAFGLSDTQGRPVAGEGESICEAP
jgi:hypothetical protein